MELVKVNMKIHIVILAASLLILAGAGCSKKYTGPPSPPANEVPLIITLNPSAGTNIAVSLADQYPFRLSINSTPPVNGVKIDIVCVREIDNTVQFSQTSQTSSSAITTIDLQVNGLIPGVVYTVKVTVTSLTKPSNTTSASFRVARK